MAQRTILHDRHVSLGGRIVDFHGWELPVQYEGVLAEHRHTRSAASLFDCSHMGQLLLRGAGAAAQLSRICTQNAEKLAVGRGRYGFLLNEDAGVIDDTILMRLAEDEFLLVVNAGTRTNDRRWVEEHLGDGVALVDRSEQGWAKIDLQGPAAFDALAPLLESDLAAMGYFSVARARCQGRDCVLSRTGYTGELGYEIMAPGDDVAAIFDALLERPEVKPAGLGARDSLRLEMGYPLYGSELSLEINPLEADLGMFVKTDNREFIGAAKLRELAEATTMKLVAFKAQARRRTGGGDPIRADGLIAGTVTSGGFSPSLEVSIGMGYVRQSLATPGTELIVETSRAELPVTVCEKPLYANGTCRTKELGKAKPSS